MISTQGSSEVTGDDHAIESSTERSWSDATRVGELVFVDLWATGPDTTLDGVFRMQALRRGAEAGTWERFDRFCRPFAPDDLGGATARMVREFGIRGERIADANPTAQVWAAFRTFCGDGPLISTDRSFFEAWSEHLEGRAGGGPTVLGLDELRRLLSPGRGSETPHRRPGRSADSFLPAELLAECGECVSRFLGLERAVHRLAALGYALAWDEMRTSEPEAAERLAVALSLAEYPSIWSRGPTELFSAADRSEDGTLETAWQALSKLSPIGGFVDSIGAGLRPRWTRERDRWIGNDAVPVQSEDSDAFDPRDYAILDEVFQEHLPSMFAGGTDRESSYRAGQHEVARGVAEALGDERLLLVHAPTGTGKTLAYLVPAVLWAVRNDVRVGISTYTRALQEQAMDSEWPRVRRALERAGLPTSPEELRVCMLKGRQNYLCWRSLRLHQPLESAGAATWLAWTQLALFGATDPTGDLDRFPGSALLGAQNERSFRREWNALVRQVRADDGCCRAGTDRKTCAAHVARERAERSHVVIANHAFVLARPTYFKHIVFDECEHLHDQAHSVWSHTMRLGEMEYVLERLRKPDRALSRAPLDRLEELIPEGSRGHDSLQDAVRSWRSSERSIEGLRHETEAFRGWRNQSQRTRHERDEHSLLREYAESIIGTGLCEARTELAASLGSLSSALADLAEELDQLQDRGVSQIRRSLDISRGMLAEHLETLHAWLPMEDGQPAFRSETFYDVEVSPRGEDVLAARVLLPNEYLGRMYYPELRSAAFLSATTYMRGGFDAARGYLGLDRAEHPREDEDRDPSRVGCMRAPDPFDYGRVLVCVPRDGPAYANGREPFLAYVREFLAHLGERTRGRILALFTNAEDVRRTGENLQGFFRARSIPFWFQGMPGTTKEELSDRFRSRVDSILLGVDTFWYGADFPGETLEYLVIVKLPYGVPDRYHHAQAAVLGPSEQRRQIYMPRALAKFRQGFGRLMRKETDRGVVFLLDGRVLDPRHRAFLQELPIENALTRDPEGTCSRVVRADTNECVRQALAHMDMVADVRRRGLDQAFGDPGPERSDPDRERSDSDRERSDPDRERSDPGRGRTAPVEGDLLIPRPNPRFPPDRVDPDPKDVPF